jgi:hypothetical protein
MQVLWFLASHCLYDETPLKDIQAALPLNLPLEDMSQAQRSAAMATLCRKAAKAWRAAETFFFRTRARYTGKGSACFTNELSHRNFRGIP